MIWLSVAIWLTVFAFAVLTEKSSPTVSLGMSFAFAVAAYFCYREAFRELRRYRKRRR